MLQRAASWKWDNETDYPIYGLIPSRNGFFKPGNDANQAWPAVRQLLFTFISRSADSVTHCHGEAGKRTSKSCRGNRRELKVNCESAILGGLHGRDAGYPAPPVQTPACSFSAPGSSVLLASAQDLAIKQTLSVAVSR
jgi:hypothetical protein